MAYRITRLIAVIKYTDGWRDMQRGEGNVVKDGNQKS